MKLEIGYILCGPIDYHLSTPQASNQIGPSKVTGKNEDVGGEGATRKARARQVSSETAITAVRA